MRNFVFFHLLFLTGKYLPHYPPHTGHHNLKTLRNVELNHEDSPSPLLQHQDEHLTPHNAAAASCKMQGEPQNSCTVQSTAFLPVSMKKCPTQSHHLENHLSSKYISWEYFPACPVCLFLLTDDEIFVSRAARPQCSVPWCGVVWCGVDTLVISELELSQGQFHFQLSNRGGGSGTGQWWLSQPVRSDCVGVARCLCAPSLVRTQGQNLLAA